MEKTHSDVPAFAKNEPCFMGIDEAGRGPVLGPMVYATCYCPLSLRKIVDDFGFADSKTLTEESRNDFFTKICATSDKIGWITEALMPNYISNCMLGRSKYNLNQISHDSAIRLVRYAIEFGVRVEELYVDTVGDPASYQRKLEECFPSVKVTVSKKADSLYPIVSAASICAKVTRDKIISDWKFVENVEIGSTDYGSGYPSDPKTKQFMADSLDSVFGFTQLVRFSWSTAACILTDKAVPVHWEDDDDSTSSSTSSKRKRDLDKVPPLTAFFGSKNKVVERTLPQHKFLRNCGLKRADRL